MGNYKGFLRILTLLVGTTAMLSTPSIGAEPGKNDDVVHPKIPITSHWYRVEGRDNGNFKIFRKYSFVPGDDDVPIRNVLMLNCASNEPAYINFVIPKQLPLKELYKQDHIKNIKFGLVIAPTSRSKERTFTLEGEVKGNQIFFDFEGDQRKAISELIRAEHFQLFFDSYRRLEFLNIDRKIDYLSTGKEQTFDEFIFEQIGAQQSLSYQVTLKKMLDSCPDIKEWNSLVYP